VQQRCILKSVESDTWPEQRRDAACLGAKYAAQFFRVPFSRLSTALNFHTTAGPGAYFSSKKMQGFENGAIHENISY
jgi:hypothetical protein